MAEFPLRIGGFTVINVSFDAATRHRFYAVSSSTTDVTVYNIPPFFNKSSIWTFFASFGPVTHLHYDQEHCFAQVSYQLKKSVDTLISSPMTVSYALHLPKAAFNQIIADSKKSWLKDSESLRNESEELLQQYFRRRVRKSESSDEESGEWTVVKPKKRRHR